MICITIMILLTIVSSTISAQDLVGQSHKQVLEYWQKTVAADQISDTEDLIRIGETIFCSFSKKVCIEFTTIISADAVAKYKEGLNANQQLRYDEKKDEWVNDAKKYVWKITKSGDADYEVTCKKL